MHDFIYRGWRTRGEKPPLTTHHTMLGMETWMQLYRALHVTRDVTGNYTLHDTEPIHGKDDREMYIGLVIGDVTFWTEGAFFHNEDDDLDVSQIVKHFTRNV